MYERRKQKEIPMPEHSSAAEIISFFTIMGLGKVMEYSEDNLGGAPGVANPGTLCGNPLGRGSPLHVPPGRPLCLLESQPDRRRFIGRACPLLGKGGLERRPDEAAQDAIRDQGIGIWKTAFSEWDTVNSFTFPIGFLQTCRRVSPG
jgi:hypothetical protein